MKPIQGILLLSVFSTMVSCSSFRLEKTATEGSPFQAIAGGPKSLSKERLPSSQVQPYQSIGIYSSGNPIQGDLLLENELSDVLYQRKIRTLTAQHLLPGADTRSLAPVVKLLRQRNFEALLVIRNLDLAAEPAGSPGGTTAVVDRGSFVLPPRFRPLRTLTATIDFVDLKQNEVLWSGTLTFQKPSDLKELIRKTAENISDYLEANRLIR